MRRVTMKRMVKSRGWLLEDTFAVLAITLAIAVALLGATLITLSITGDLGEWVGSQLDSRTGPAGHAWAVGSTNIVSGPLIGLMLLCTGLYQAARRLRRSF